MHGVQYLSAMARQLQYDFTALAEAHPELSHYVVNARGYETIDFGNPSAVRALNIALLKKDYMLSYYDLPEENLIPAVPGRWQYIKELAQLFVQSGASKRAKMHILDIGTGANVIYPLLAHQRLGWTAVGSDISEVSLTHAQQILDRNGIPKTAVELVHQANPQHILRGVIDDMDYVDAVVFNPPFYDTAESQDANVHKAQKLGTEAVRNFGGKEHEIACDGGELRILKDYITESKTYANKAYWYTCLVSQGVNLKPLTKMLKALPQMTHGTMAIDTTNKKARVLFWSFLSPKQSQAWSTYRWR